ncbi:hypothetical protein ACLMJK_001274 [Lecanora helva]
MLTASILKIFYWPGARYDPTLLIQAIVMVAVQIVLLKVALDNRPVRRDEGPFKGMDSGSSLYTQIIGYVGLAVEAVLPLPQMFANQRAQSCKGFRVSVLANWLVGDAMKMGYFFNSEAGKVPWAFKMCGIFQACCDVGLGVQYWTFGDGEENKERRYGVDKDGRLA